MKVYVGTYGKYNNGSIAGAWLNLDDYKDYREFLIAATKLHKDEVDPELMIQDTETDGADWQAGFTGENVSDYADYWTVKAEAEANGGECREPIATVTRNEAKNGIEIKFFERPAQSVIDDLKARRWRWSRFAGCWYTRYSEEAAKYAAEVAGGVTVESGIKAVEKKLAEIKDENVNTPEVRAEFRADIANVWHDQKMRDYCDKKAEVVVRLTNGELVSIEKPSITTSHCEGEDDGRGRSMKDAMAGCRYFETEEGFKRTNIREFDREIIHHVGRKLEYVLGYKEKFVVGSQYWHDSGRLAYCCKRANTDSRDMVLREANAEDIRRLRLGWAMVRRNFIKRVNAYWKRFGNTKLRTWTFWTEA